MDENQDFSALRNLLAASKLDMPKDTQIDQFLVEFHRRQRAQLLVPQSILARATGWMKEKVAGFELIPAFSYAGVVGAIALTAFFGLSQQVQVVTTGDGQSKLNFRMAAQDTTFAMVPVSFTPLTTVSPKKSDSPNFTANRSEASATRYILANSQGDHDATVAF